MPSISSSGTPSASGPDDFFVNAANPVNGQYGFVLWSLGPNDLPLYGGTLCLAPPLARLPIQFTGGSSAPADCSGSIAFHSSQAHMAATGLGAGSRVYFQC